MHSMPLRAAARRTAVAATMTAVTATGLVWPPAASAVPAPATSATPKADVMRDANLVRRERVAERRAEHLAKLRAERRAERRAAEAAQERGARIVELVSREAGKPYVYGAAGPDAFDCSGLTMYVFAQLGISLPHSAAAQAAMAQPVSDPQVGDLVFFGAAGGVYHVAIYAGDGYVWHAPHPGTVVSKEKIWTSDVFYGRV